jgi:KilA-N domain
MNIPNEYRNLSVIAKASEKRLNNWVNRSEGKKAIAEFKLKYPEIDCPLVTKKGRGGGTWGHPELAAVFAAWCNPWFTAKVVEQNIQLKDQNELLKEKIRTFQVNTPAEIESARDEAEKVKQMAYQAANKGAEEIELIAKCHYVRAITWHPKGMTFEQYLPHWLHSMSDRTDIYPREVLEEMTKKAGKPLKIQGKILKHGYSYVWI